MVLPTAISNEEDLVTLVAHNADDVMTTIAPEIRLLRSNATKRTVLCETGDTILSCWATFRDEGLSLIKIDIEGAELEVLEGITGAIERTRAPIVFEIIQKASENRPREHNCCQTPTTY